MLQAKQAHGRRPRINAHQPPFFLPMKKGQDVSTLIAAATGVPRAKPKNQQKLDVFPTPLDWKDSDGISAARALIVTAFDNAERYPDQRITQELQPATEPEYRQFIVAWHEGRMVGAGGIKSAGWASDTHVLYLSAVESAMRGKGIGRALVRARLDWIVARHKHGRILVSTLKPKRYRDFGFREVCRQACPAPRLMLLEF